MLFTWAALEGGGGIRARGADGVCAASQKVGHAGQQEVTEVTERQTG